jgi:hypothetical protein
MATERQIPVVAARFVEYQQGFSELPNEDAQWVMNHAEDAIVICVKAIVNRAKDVIQILGGVVLTVIVPSTTKKFVAKDKFKVDVSEKAEVKISGLGDNFKAWFLKKIEPPFAGSTINGRKLEKNFVDGPIIKELGAEKAAEIMLAELFSAMKAQQDGEHNSLLAYILDINGILRAVGVRWVGGGWRVSALSVENPSEWNAGYVVFSRNSSGA